MFSNYGKKSTTAVVLMLASFILLTSAVGALPSRPENWTTDWESTSHPSCGEDFNMVAVGANGGNDEVIWTWEANSDGTGKIIGWDNDPEKDEVGQFFLHFPQNVDTNEEDNADWKGGPEATPKTDDEHPYWSETFEVTEGDIYQARTGGDSMWAAFCFNHDDVPEAPMCLQDDLSATLNENTMIAKVSGKGVNAKSWEVVDVAAKTVLASGEGNDVVDQEVPVDYDTNYQLVFIGEDGSRSSGCVFRFTDDDDWHGAAAHMLKTVTVQCGKVQETIDQRIAQGSWFDQAYMGLVPFDGDHYIDKLLTYEPGVEPGKPFDYTCQEYGGPEALVELRMPRANFTLTDWDGGRSPLNDHNEAQDGKEDWTGWDACVTGQDGVCSVLLPYRVEARDLYAFTPAANELPDVPVCGDGNCELVENFFVTLARNMGSSTGTWNASPAINFCPDLIWRPNSERISVFCGRFTNRLNETPDTPPPPPSNGPENGLGAPEDEMVWSSDHIGRITAGMCDLSVPLILTQGTQTSEWTKGGFHPELNAIGVHNTLGNIGPNNPGGCLLQFQPGHRVLVELNGESSWYEVVTVGNVDRGPEWASRLANVQAAENLVLFTCDGYSETGLFTQYRRVELLPVTG